MTNEKYEAWLDTPMTTFENLARLFPLHIQRIAELTQTKEMLHRYSFGRWHDLACLFLWDSTTEGHDYWRALATGEGLDE